VRRRSGRPTLAQRRFDALAALADTILDDPKLPTTRAGAPGLVLLGDEETLARVRRDAEPEPPAEAVDDDEPDEDQPEQSAQSTEPVEPVELAGYGPIPDWLARELLAHRHTRVMVLDPRLRLDCRPVPGYDVPDWMAGQVLAVHRRCVFPGCGVPAYRCDLDSETGRAIRAAA
jgi:hypothetical protein